MPTYQYACTVCGHRFEAVQSFSDASLSECPQCSGKLRKLFGSVGVVFKGSGFYRTDSRAEASGKGKSTVPAGKSGADGGSSSTSSGSGSDSGGSSSGSSGSGSTSTSSSSSSSGGSNSSSSSSSSSGASKAAP